MLPERRRNLHVLSIQGKNAREFPRTPQICHCVRDLLQRHACGHGMQLVDKIAWPPDITVLIKGEQNNPATQLSQLFKKPMAGVAARNT